MLNEIQKQAIEAGVRHLFEAIVAPEVPFLTAKLILEEIFKEGISTDMQLALESTPISDVVGQLVKIYTHPNPQEFLSLPAHNWPGQTTDTTLAPTKRDVQIALQDLASKFLLELLQKESERTRSNNLLKTILV